MKDRSKDIIDWIVGGGRQLVALEVEAILREARSVINVA